MIDTSNSRHLVFVYGTLKRGFPNHDAELQGEMCLGKFVTTEAYPLVIVGPWRSPVLIDEPGRGHRVRGEVYQVDDGVLAALDRLESTHLHTGYHRILVRAVPAGEDDRDVGNYWAYLKHRDRIPAVLSEPMAEYPLDTRYVPSAQRPT